MGLKSEIDRRQSEQRRAWHAGKTIYVSGAGRFYHLPGQCKDDGSLKSLCGKATGKIGVWGCLQKRETERLELCKRCAHLSGTPVERNPARLARIKEERRKEAKPAKSQPRDHDTLRRSVLAAAEAVEKVAG